jgi:protein O-mannose beta-1,4-N-acetylglucosaminyltransferase
MARIREVEIRSSAPPKCTVRHDVPAVIFSTGGCGKNFFHAMSDLVVPLYTSAHEYNGQVQLLITDYNTGWVAKFKAILAALSVYPVIDLDADTAVRCVPSAQVGLESHRILSIDPALSRTGETMVGFRDFLRSVFSLPRSRTTPVSRSSGQKPRLVFVLRRHSRAVTNEADAMAALADVGFEVVAAGPEDASDIARFAAVVNSCDVMLGVHGAGLTNMVFLPHNGTIVQIIPWGAMKYPCRYDFGDPVPDMGLRYEEYEVTADETTLKDMYPRNHPVFTDPVSFHRKGKMWEVFLEPQNVTLDIDRFRGAMQQLYQSITRE